jgi:2,5-diamino-6-(ribosylamino)-4(3H)-pyrimidinone 5'-phosphate reductase
LDAKALRLYPLPSEELLMEGIYDDLELPPREGSGASRPYVIINMVASLDGRATIGGRTAGIGGETDRQTMRNLRSKADAVMIGAGTLRAERLSLGLDDPAGSRQPLAVIVSSTGNVPLEDKLIGYERQSVLVLTMQHALDDRLRGRARVVRVPASPSGGVDLTEALKILKADHGVGLLLVEGGPSLNHSLISQNLADELFLTLAPKLLGGLPEETLTILQGSLLGDVAQLCLISVHVSGDELFLRYTLSKA